jgi:hypothetical protein
MAVQERACRKDLNQSTHCRGWNLRLFVQSPNELQIEIENVSGKPIYFINAVLSFPDDPVPNGISGILLQYGKLENLDIARLAAAGDEHLDPGETTTLVISNVYKKGLIAKAKEGPTES